jgi:protein SCO1/2
MVTHPPVPRAQALFIAAILSMSGACTPIPARDVGNRDRENQEPTADTDLFSYDPDTRAVRIGEVVPDRELRDEEGRTVRLSQFRDRVVVMTFFADADTDGLDKEILVRFARVESALTPALARDVMLVALLVDASAAAPALLRSYAAMASRADVRWMFARASPHATAALVAAFGVVIWENPDGGVEHTFNTVIIDRGGRLVDQFPGLDTWSAMDVVAAASLAAGR